MSAALAATLLWALPTVPAQAITYGSPDCAINALDLNCRNPNVVSLSGVTPDFFLNGRCTGSVLRKEPDRVLILTAGHCAQYWMRGMQQGWIETVGVSFEADVTDESPQFLQYVPGGKPLLHRLYGPSSNSFNIYYDYAVIAFPASDGNLTSYDGGTVDLSQVSPVNLPPVNYLQGLLTPTNPPLLTNVGYGISEWLNGPKTGGNAGGLTLKRAYGERYVSEYSAVFNSLMPGASIAIASMNPAQGYEGVCNGDSGGPNFHVVDGTPIQVGVSSSGDKYCRATTLIARLDIPQAVNFLACAANAVTPAAYSACGCTTLNKKWLCPK